MAAAPDAERTERTGGGHECLAHAVDDGGRRAFSKSLEQRLERATRAFGDAAHGAGRGVGDPAVELERGRLADDEEAEADALDPAGDGGVEADAVGAPIVVSRHGRGSGRAPGG